jgi:hypothetical protein
MTRAAVCSSLASLCSLLPPSGPLPRGSLRPRSGPFSVRDPSAWPSGRVALRHRGLLEDLQDRCVHELCHGREADGAKSVPRTPSATQCPSCARGQAGTNRIVFFVTGPLNFSVGQGRADAGKYAVSCSQCTSSVRFGLGSLVTPAVFLMPESRIERSPPSHLVDDRIWWTRVPRDRICSIWSGRDFALLGIRSLQALVFAEFLIC